MTRLTEDELDNKISEALEFYKKEDKDFGWLISPQSTPKSLGDKLVSAGFTKKYDMIGMDYIFEQGRVTCPTDDESAIGLANLAEAGHLSQLLLSQDVFLKSMLSAHGGKGYTHLFSEFLPRLLGHGFGQDELNQMMISNPAMALTIRN